MTLLPIPAVEELRDYMRSPITDRRELWRSIDRFVTGELLVQHRDPIAPDGSETGKFAARFDAHDMNIASQPIGDGVWPWVWWFAVSARAPLITCRTFSLKPIFRANLPAAGTDYLPEEPPRAQAVEWTTRVAGAFGLQLVDAEQMRKCVVSYDEVDRDFEFALQHQPDEPNAFQVLFLEN
jgi:hypothetical protein